MKKILSLVCLCSALCGCAILGPNKGPSVPLIAEVAFYDATWYVLKEHPNHKPDFAAAIAELEAFLESSKFSVADLGRVISKVNVKEINGSWQSLTLNNLAILLGGYDASLVSLSDKEKTAKYRELFEAALRGLKRGYESS